ncbi:MAG: helix-turn-helix transcriptional regulator [Cyanobacteria bacterium CRU_2_1]|nr:helix-turn-helix transcriptional regulator [Cyanobacteria bacterium RU_5_0]NJR58569.1 helix-turn-helix transcriptional regulator [Cyanobacteria bacterium CRU_2_1]
MGKAGKSLKQVLETYDISQNRLAIAMGIRAANVNRWVNEVRDPGAETLLEIRNGLRKIDRAASDEFIRLYLADSEVADSEDE